MRQGGLLLELSVPATANVAFMRNSGMHWQTGRPMHNPTPPLLASLVFALACVTPARALEGMFENEPVLDAASLAQPALLNGPGYKVAPRVAIGGYMARFHITTPYGPLDADSVQLLAIRIAELPAIETLNEASRKGAFAHALAERGKKTGNAIVNVFSHPVDSIVGLPMGVVHYFKKQIDTWSGRAQSASDRSSRIFENKGDPYRAPPGPMVAGRGVERTRSEVSVGNATRSETTETDVAVDTKATDDVVTPVIAGDPGDDRGPEVQAPPADAAAAGASERAPGAEDRKSHAWYARAGSELGRETKRYLKYNQARREIAKYLGIDPDTSNPYIVERLDTLAWAATWGNFSAGQALGAIAGPAATLITDTGMINEYVLTHTPEQVRERNEKMLQSVCSDEFGIRQFLRRGGFNDTLRTQFVDSLVKLKPHGGCNEVLELAATSHGEVEGRYLVDALALIERHSPTPYDGKLVIAGAAIAWVGANDSLCLPMPVDYLSWTADMGDFFDRPEFVRGDKTVLIGGEITPKALHKLGERGWRVQVRAPYAGAPSYAAGLDRTAR